MGADKARRNQYGVSPYSLRLYDPEMAKDYHVYLSNEVRGQSFVFLYGLLAIATVLLILTIGKMLDKKKEDADQMTLLMLIIHGVLALFVAVNLAISKKSPQFV